MPTISTYGCEPLRAWNRLEGRPRTLEFDRVLEAGVYDALWMLTRQWQFGELQGEDTGSAIFSKILMQYAPISRIKKANGDPQNYSDNLPLEQVIENIPTRLDYKAMLDAAYAFMKYMDNIAARFAVAGYDRKVYKARLKSLYPLDAVSAVQPGDTADQILSKLEVLSNENYLSIANTTSPKYFDGIKLYNAILADKYGTVNIILNGNAAHNSMVTQAVSEFKFWVERNYDMSATPPKTAWVPQQLEYRFDCTVPASAGNQVLTAGEYYQGSLDWYAVDVNKAAAITGLSGPATAQELQTIKNDLITVIPTEAKFAGAPNSRWWQFENGNVDLGNINATTTDIAKLVCTEYALLYNTDWLIVPYPVKVGMVCDVKGIVVTDVFGEQSFVQPAVQGQTDNWSGWGMFNMSTIESSSLRTSPVDTRLFIPPAIVKGMESEPLEEVHFLRDEMTNNVWALEVTVPDKLGATIDGHQLARNYNSLLQQLDTPPAPGQQQNAVYKYMLGNSVPENWIPFVPVHVPTSTRKIQLQRASMPRFFKNAYTHIRPRTPLLRQGLNDLNNQDKAYFIHEEEVPRSGIQVTGVAQRTRWYNGGVVNWYGYRKQAGRGEGSSGLVYDRMEAANK
jgi:hypothetical protein